MNNLLKTIAVPTILIEGSEGMAAEHAEQLLRQVFCKQQNADDKNEDCFCSECRKIKQRQHYCLMWICPEKDYTVDLVEQVFDQIRLTLDEDQRFFFVLEKAQTLNLATANRLLKILEEPPKGYCFLLLTTNKNAILPTIISRSYVIPLAAAQNSDEFHPLLNFFFSAEKLSDVFGFEQELKKQQLSDNETVELCFSMLTTFSQRLANCYHNKGTGDPEMLTNCINTIKHHLKTPPASGSSDFFWKRLFLHFPRP